MSETEQNSSNVNAGSQDGESGRHQFRLPQHRDPAKNAALFNSKMSESQIQRNVIKLYGDQYMEAIADTDVLIDRVSVQDLKVILRGLRLAAGHALNAKKQILASQLQSYMQSDHMKELYEKYLVDREEQRKERQRKREEKLKNRKDDNGDEKSNGGKSEEEEDEMSDSENEQKDAGKQKKGNGNNGQHKRTFPMRRKPQSSGNNTKNIVIPRLKYEGDFDVERAVRFIQSANEFINHVSVRLNDIERAMSIMSFRLSELEKVYMQNN